MPGELREEALDAARSLVGALLLGIPLLYTMETWWLGWRLPAWLILSYSLVGLAAISVVTHFVGYHRHKEGRGPRWLRELRGFAELFSICVVGAVAVLLLMGVPDDGLRGLDLARLALLQVVPLGLGAALTNVALKSAEESEDAPTLGREMAIFATGALFFSLPIAPTEEMQLIAAQAGPWRLVGMAAAALALTYLTLHVLEFRGHAGRASTPLVEIGQTVTGYAVALIVSAALLAGFGHFLDAAPPEMLQQTVGLSLVASLGGAAARVVL